MSKRFIDGAGLASMAAAAAGRLRAKVQQVNALNVFPVPDGDTGTNMDLTLASGVEELRRRPAAGIGQAADILARGLLMGARGNSGVILSQLFRGFAKGMSGLTQANAAQFAQAFQLGVETAYAAVVRPVEGTILTVSKDAAKAAGQAASRTDDLEAVMRETLAAAREALARTPDLLPVLKQVGVVDSGGQGLVHIYEGFLSAMTGEAPSETAPAAVRSRPAAAAAPHAPVQAHFEAESIEHGYCTEFIVRLAAGGQSSGGGFEERAFRDRLGQWGDSLLVVADRDLVKVHIHAEFPGEVMTYAQKFGELSRIKIENMREQHSHILSEEYGSVPDGDGGAPALRETKPASPVSLVASHGHGGETRPFGLVAVASGEGIAHIFSSLGVDCVLSGGQTMNPSTEDILGAIERVAADRVFVLPNNANIVLAAGQARDMSAKEAAVIPTKTIQQGFAAVLAMQEHVSFERNAQAMAAAAGRVKSGQVTVAVRDSSIDGVHIREGEHIGILDGHIVVSRRDLFETCEALLREMVVGGDETVSVIAGEAADEAVTGRLRSWVADTFPDAEVEWLNGGQPVYSYLFSAE